MVEVKLRESLYVKIGEQKWCYNMYGTVMSMAMKPSNLTVVPHRWKTFLVCVYVCANAVGIKIASAEHTTVQGESMTAEMNFKNHLENIGLLWRWTKQQQKKKKKCLHPFSFYTMLALSYFRMAKNIVYRFECDAEIFGLLLSFVYCDHYVSMVEQVSHHWKRCA